jgi:S1-C subfamily serine protease
MDRGVIQNNMGSKLSDRRTGFPNILQHDTVLRPEDCGGPLVELDGKAVGINIARAGRTESYAIPSDVVRTLVPELKSGKLAPKPVAAPDPTVKKKLTELEAAVKRAEQQLADLEKKSTAARDILKKAEEAKNAYGKTDPDLIEVFNKAQTFSQSVDKQVARAKTALEKARAELKKAQDETK